MLQYWFYFSDYCSSTVNPPWFVPLCEVWCHTPFEFMSSSTQCPPLRLCLGWVTIIISISLELYKSFKSQAPSSTMVLIINAPERPFLCWRVVLGIWCWEEVVGYLRGRAYWEGIQSFPLLLFAPWPLNRRFDSLTYSYLDVCHRAKVTNQSIQIKTLKYTYTEHFLFVNRSYIFSIVREHQQTYSLTTIFITWSYR